MPLPKEPSKPATTLNEIPPITAPKPRKTARKIENSNTATAAGKAPLTLAANNAVTAKAPDTVRSRNIPAAAANKARRPGTTPISKTNRQVTHTGKKIFVLDTNVLMHDPMSLFRFEEHDIFLPMIVLEELDGRGGGWILRARLSVHAGSTGVEGDLSHDPSRWQRTADDSGLGRRG